jgi:ribosomal-protein-alanine N-acetyltransferase
VPVLIRRLEGEDVDEVAALSARCFPSGGWTAADLHDEQARDFAEVWVATDAGRIVGYAVGWFVGDDAEIMTLGTDPSAQRRGVGRALVLRLQESACARAMSSLTLEVRVSNEAARALYRHAGFADVALRRGYYADGEDAQIMQWRPTPGTTPAPA